MGSHRAKNIGLGVGRSGQATSRTCDVQLGPISSSVLPVGGTSAAAALTHPVQWWTDILPGQ